MSLQERLFAELNDAAHFDKIYQHAYNYYSTAHTKNAYPSEQEYVKLKHFDEELSNEGTGMETITKSLLEYGQPLMVNSLGGRYFGFVNGGMLPAGIASRILSDFWDQNAALQVMSPLVSKLELQVEKWLCNLFDLPKDSAAGFVSGTTSAIFCGLAAARWRILHRLGWDVSVRGLNGSPTIKIICSDESHAAVFRALSLLGLGNEEVTKIPTDDQGRVIAEEVPPLDDKTILILQAGNVNTGSFDPFAEILASAKRNNAWIHIDGAFGLWAKASSKFNHLTKGMELANSYSVDGHKTLNTPYDNGIVLCTDREAILEALNFSGSYLQYGEIRDGMKYTTEMSRRNRIVELWACLKSLGLNGIGELVELLHERAVLFSVKLATLGYEIINDVEFNQVLVKLDTKEKTLNALSYIQKSEICWCGPTVFKGQTGIRISVCSWTTTTKDIELSSEVFAKAMNAN